MSVRQCFGSRGIVKVSLFVTAAVFFGLPARAQVNLGSGSVVQLAWNGSPGANVVGYNLYYGVQSGSCTNRIVLGNVTNASVSGAPGAAYYFTVTARDSTGDESPPSNETSCTFPNPSVATANLAIRPVAPQISGISNVFTLTSAGAISSGWVLETSADLKNWQPLATGSNSTVNAAVTNGGGSALFFRLLGP